MTMRQITKQFPMKARLARTLLILFAVWVSCIPVQVSGQECYPTEVIETVRSVRKDYAQKLFNVAQLPDARERILGLQQKTRGENADLRTIRFFEVTPAVHEVIKGKLESTTVHLDSDPVWIV